MDFSQFISLVGSHVAREIRFDDQRTNAYLNGVGQLMKHAVAWSSVGASGITCETVYRRFGGMERCGGAAIAGCVVCGRPTCFEHAMVSPRDGTAICFGCVGQAQRTAAGGPAPVGPEFDTNEEPAKKHDPDAVERLRVEHQQMLRAQHLSTLGLDSEAHWQQIQTAYKRLARVHHPDRVKAADRAKAHRRMAEINAAYQWLNEHRRAA